MTNPVAPYSHTKCLRMAVTKFTSLRQSSCHPTALHTASNQLQPLVAPQVSHFSQVPFLTIVKFWHSPHMLPVYP